MPQSNPGTVYMLRLPGLLANKRDVIAEVSNSLACVGLSRVCLAEFASSVKRGAGFGPWGRVAVRLDGEPCGF